MPGTTKKRTLRKITPKRDGDEQARRGEAQRLERARAVHADRDHREFDRGGEGDELGDSVLDRVDQAADLVDAQRIAELPGRDQQHEVEQAEQQHGVRNIVLEQPDHRRSSPCDPRVNKSDTQHGLSQKLTNKG